MLSFVFQQVEAGKRIKAIYLFGSAVRGELQSKSDIDLFVECAKEDETRVKQLLDSGIVKFETSKDYLKWKLFHFTYPFSYQVGRLEEWELKLSILSEGILLYNIQSGLQGGERSVLFSIIFPKEKKEYIKVRRLLFGRDEKFYRGGGRVQEVKGKKISSSVFIIPKEEQGEMMQVLSKTKIAFSMTEVIWLKS